MLKTCENGHQFFKSSDCPTCPICEHVNKPKDSFLSFLSGPARRALENNKVYSLEKLSQFSEAEILKFHGMGHASIPKLRKALTDAGLSFIKVFRGKSIKKYDRSF